MPNENIPVCVYGLPLTVAYKCVSCGKTIIHRGLGYGSIEYCPKCGFDVERVKIRRK